MIGSGVINITYQDTNQVDSNFERINFWSTVHLIMMIVVGVTQVKPFHNLNLLMLQFLFPGCDGEKLLL